jgi:hypothetical protein
LLTRFSDICRTAPLRTAWPSPAAICLLLGLLGALPMVVLTPPFQVPDEPQHFLRAYQLSELQLRGVVQEGEARAMLPSSLIELIETFLGTRAVHALRPITPQPLRQTWLALDRPLEPERREFVNLPLTVYPPPPYLPIAIAIAIGRWLGAGPLELLYFARLMNALVAVTVLACAVRLIPVGREITMLFGLLPMATYQYASVSPDAAVITTAFLFTALARRCQLRACWSPGDVGLAMASGLVFCAQKPVYALLLLIGMPAALVQGRAKQILLLHAAIVIVVLGSAVAWWRFASPMFTIIPGSSVSGQAAFIVLHPLAFIRTVAVTFCRNYLYYKTVVGVLGWLTLSLPALGYILPICGFLLGTLAQSRDGPRQPAQAVAWHILLLAGTGLLIMTSAYLLWNTVGSRTVQDLQGRYFLPLLALAAATWCSVVRIPLSRRGSRAALLMLVALIIGEYSVMDLTIVKAYHVF